MEYFGHNPFRTRRGFQNNPNCANNYGPLCTDILTTDVMKKNLFLFRLSQKLMLDYVIRLGPSASLTFL